MELFETFQSRRSIRAFQPKAVEPAKVQQILEAANLAPSAGNLQAYEIYVIAEASAREKLAGAIPTQEFIGQAPVVLVFCAHPSRAEGRYRERGVHLYSVQDATIACTYAMLTAASLGLGSVWVGAFNESAVQAAIHADQGVRPVAILPIGYAAEEPEPKTRRALSDLVHEVKG